MILRALLLLLLWASPASAAVLWFDGAEIGDTKECSQTDNSSRTSAVTSPVFTGFYAVQSQTNTSFSGFCIGRKGLSTSTLFARFRFREGGLPTTTQNVGRFLNAAQTDAIELCQDTSGKLCWRLASGGVVTTGTTVLSINTWYLIEFKAVVSAGAGGVEVKINGATEFTSLGTNTSGVGNVDQLQVGPARDETPAGRNTWYDDLMVCDTSYCPQGGTIARQGTSGTPTYNAWTKNGCLTIDLCWSDTPFNSLSNASSATAAQAQTMLVSPFSTTQTGHGSQVILGGATINACKAGFVGAVLASSQVSIRRRIGGADTDTSVTLVGSPSWVDDGIWTTTVGNLSTGPEVGAVHAAGTDTQSVYDAWIHCDFLGGGPGPKHRVNID